MRRSGMVVLMLWVGVAAPCFAAVTVETTRVAHGVRAWYAADDAVPVVDVLLSFEGAGTTSDTEGKGGRAAFAAATSAAQSSSQSMLLLLLDSSAPSQQSQTPSFTREMGIRRSGCWGH